MMIERVPPLHLLCNSSPICGSTTAGWGRPGGALNVVVEARARLTCENIANFQGFFVIKLALRVERSTSLFGETRFHTKRLKEGLAKYTSFIE